MSMASDNPDPADVDWTAATDSAVYYAARDGIPEAVAEAARRNAQGAQ